MNSRAHAALILEDILSKGKNIHEPLSHIKKDKPFIQELCYGVCRYYYTLTFIAKKLLKKPFSEKDQDIFALILVGLYQLIYLDTETFAAINESVEAAKQLKKKWAAGLINAVLRNFTRNKNDLLQICSKDESAHYAHPQWLIQRIKKTYPKQWKRILEQNNKKPPMILRVNQQTTTREEYLQALKGENIDAKPCSYTDNGIILDTPTDVKKLPGFLSGSISVQDEGAQLATELLEIKPGQRILDACSAPGGKTCHILELEPSVDLIAIDNNEARQQLVTENLNRLKLTAKLITADVRHPENWWDKKPFSKILLDAPCSATGVIRRHPDIKLLRKDKDINKLAQTQLSLLNALWPLLEDDGILLYVTCSILQNENDELISTFLTQHANARAVPIESAWGITTTHGKQLLPGKTDGFYFAKLSKTV